MFPDLIDRRDRFADARGGSSLRDLDGGPGARITAMGQLPALLGVA
jgi:hypothetical protein